MKCNKIKAAVGRVLGAVSSARRSPSPRWQGAALRFVLQQSSSCAAGIGSERHQKLGHRSTSGRWCGGSGFCLFALCILFLSRAEHGWEAEGVSYGSSACMHLSEVWKVQ